MHLQRVVERRGQAGRVAGELSERGAELPAVNVLRALGGGSGGLTLVGVLGGVVAQRRGALVGRGTDPRVLRAGAVGRMRGVRRVRFHGGHGGGQRAVVGPGRAAEFVQSGLRAGKHARLTLTHVRAVGGVREGQGGAARETWRTRRRRRRGRVGGGVEI